MNLNKDYVICEICGTSFYTSSEIEICASCLTRFEKSDKKKAPINPVLKANRDIAKGFGGKALTGTAKQKEWAEKIRAEKLVKLPEDDARKIASGGGFLDTSKFWIDNRDKTFNWLDVIAARDALVAVKEKHYRTLVSSTTAEMNAAKDEVKVTIKNAAVMIRTTFPNFDPYEALESDNKPKMPWQR